VDGGIFLLGDDGGLVKLIERPYDAEDRLQALLADHPDLLAGEQIDSVLPRRWLHVKREAGIPGEAGGADRWALDHLFLDQVAIPTFVEVKRSSNTQIRREIVGQMLDYAANATRYWPVDSMREHFSAVCTARQIDPVVALGEWLGPDIDAEQFWDLARRNLREGRLRLLFVADAIPPELRSIVEFLNHQMSPAEVLAVEIRQYVGGDPARPLRTLVPRVFGQTEAAKQAKGTASGDPLVASEAELLDRSPEAARPVVKAVLDVARAQGYEVQIRTPRSRKQFFRIVLPSSGAAPFSVYTDGYLWVSLGRHLPPLREPSINEELRLKLAAFAPGRRTQAMDLTKSEVGVPLTQIDPQRDLDRFAELAGFVADALR
jgi:hypothetical protein